MARIILYTDKSEVEETTRAAAKTLRPTELFFRTMIPKTDAAHSLADSFDISLGNRPQPVAPNLWGEETSISRTLEAYCCTIQKTSNKDEEV